MYAGRADTFDPGGNPDLGGPKMLNFIVAIYLILIGLAGLFHWG